VRFAERARQAGQVDAEADEEDEEEEEEAAGAAGGGGAAAGARAIARKKTRADRNRAGRRRQAEVRPRAGCAPPTARLPRWCPAACRARPRCAKQLAAPEALAQRDICYMKGTTWEPGQLRHMYLVFLFCLCATTAGINSMKG